MNDNKDGAFDTVPVERVMSSVPPLQHAGGGGSTNALNGNQDDVNKALKRRIAQLEAENERLKSSVVALTERLCRKRRDSGSLSLDSLLISSATVQASGNAPGQSLTPSPTIAPLPPPTARRHSNETSAIHSRSNRDQLILDDDLDGPDPLHLASDQYGCRSTFSMQNSPIYQCKFNHEGTLLACTGMDSLVHLWTFNGASEVTIGTHAQAGSDLAWLGTNLIASSSLDMSVKLWDVSKVNADCPVANFSTSGLALCLAALPDSTSVVVGTSSGAIHLFDVRVPSSGSSSVSSAGSSGGAGGGASESLLHAEGSVNAICCGSNANAILSGDSKGVVRAFDMRMAGHLDLFVVDGKRPISGLAWSPIGSGLLAVNSYDNALRVFARDPTADSIKLVHTLRGHRSKNLPVRSCFSLEQPLQRPGGNAFGVSLATGSANNSCYVFHPITAVHDEPVSTQVLKGHTGSVYACDFSVENLLATCSVDGTIRLWSKRT